METVSNVVNAASKAIWGEQPSTTTAAADNETAGSEPISGQQGKGTVAEPYDQGNAGLDEQHATATTLGNETGGKEPVSGFQGKGTVSEPFDQGNAADLADTVGKSNISDPTSTSKPENTTHEPTAFKQYKPDASNADAGVVSELPIRSAVPKSDEDSKPSTGKDDSGVFAPAQNYTFVDGKLAPTEDSDKIGTAPSSGAALGSTLKSDETHAIKPKQDAEPLVATHAGIETSSTQGEQHELKGGLTTGPSKPESAGEPPAKTAALLSDNTDLKSEKPSAGKEADRIVEEKREHNTSSKLDSQPVAPAAGEKEKVSKLDKLKDKLHIGHKDK